ncbi:hypothetical protein Tco_1344711 [Tanacetum coccineum]
MDPNSSLGKMCLEDNTIIISSDKIEGAEEWDSTEYKDTAISKKKKEPKGLIFEKLDTEDISDRYIAPCFVNGLEVHDGEINLGAENNMISRENAVKLCLEHEGVIFGRSFLRLTKEIANFGVGTITIYPELDPFLNDTDEDEK